MANGAALIHESLWRRDREFRRLPRLAQCTYLQLLSQKDLDCAGGLTLYLDLLAKGCEELTVAALVEDLKTLEAARFVFVDFDTDELLIRSYFRLVSVKSPNAYKSGLRAAKMINSEKLRAEFAAELRRVGRKDAIALADDLSPSEPVTNPVETPSEPLPIPISPSKPPVTVTVSGHLLSVDGQFGENEPPPKFCPKHMPDGTPDACGACRGYRQRRDTWDAAHATAQRQRGNAFRAEVRDCADCDPNGLAETTTGVTRCPNHDWTNLEPAHA